LPAIITRQDYMYFIQNNRRLREETDKGKKSNVMELLLAKILITRNLEGWWESAAQEIDTWVRGLKLSSPSQHPLAKFLTQWGERNVRPETYGLLIKFAADLLDVVDEKDSNFESKIPELMSASFFETWFEISVASVFIRKGMQAKFIPSSSREKRPDIEVAFNGSKALVECKVRAKLSTEERSSDDVYRSKMDSRLESVKALLANASEKAKSPNCPYVVSLRIEHPNTILGSLERKMLRSQIETFLVRNTNVTAVVTFEERNETVEDLTQFQTELSVIVGQLATHKLPDLFYQTLLNPDIDSRPKVDVLATYALKH
jgi:hypothetical protein